jgi:hypothetical protein
MVEVARVTREIVDEMMDLDAFVTDGYLTIERAVPRSVADEARSMQWRQLGT